MIDPQKALTMLMAKWTLSTLKHGQLNFKALIRYKIIQYQPHTRGLWASSPEWCLQPERRASTGSSLWKRTTTAWKVMSKDIVQLAPRTYLKWTSSNSWFQLLLEYTRAGISQSRSMILFNIGIRQIADVWVEEYQRFLSS
jgi:hypothetical protein